MKKLHIFVSCIMLGILLAGCSSVSGSPDKNALGTTESTQQTERNTEQTDGSDQNSDGSTAAGTVEAGVDQSGNIEQWKDTATTENVESDTEEAVAEKATSEYDVKAELGIPEKQTTEASWQTAYVDYLNNASDVDDQEGYTLIDIDGDAGPELVEVGRSEASGVRIINYADGEVHVNDLNRLYFSYIKGKNLLCNSDGLMDSYYDSVYSIVDGELTLVAQGHYGVEEDTDAQLDANGTPDYVYSWNGEDVSKEKYQEEFQTTYDSSNAVDGYDPDQLESIKQIIADIESR